MFVAWREMRGATTRFVLVGVVVALITGLVTFPSGLIGGLVQQNISAITDLPADRIVFGVPAGGNRSFEDSTVTARQADTWAQAPGVERVDAVGIGQTRLVLGDAQQSVTVFGSDLYRQYLPAGQDREDLAGAVVVPRGLAEELRADAGDRVLMGGRPHRVVVSDATQWYSHMPVVWTSLETWRDLGGTSEAVSPFATVLAVSGSGIDVEAADVAAGTESTTVRGSLSALASFTSEVGSLLLMVGLLFAISALVIGAFFNIWSMQRRGDVAVLRALGATTRRLMTDALGQALVLLVGGVAVGLALASSGALLASAGLPYVFSPLTTLAPAAITIALGLLGAAVATRSVTRIDPLVALGSNR